MSITAHRMTGDDTGIKERLQMLAPHPRRRSTLSPSRASTPASDHQRRYCERETVSRRDRDALSRKADDCKCAST